MGFLSGIFGGGSPTVQTQTTSSSPWSAQQPYLKEMFQGAQQAFQSDAPSYFPESTVVGFSPQTEQALRMTEEQALSGSPVQQGAMDLAASTLQGDYLSGSPFLTGAYEAATRPVIEQFQEQIAPGIDSSFIGAGRLGSGAYAQARNRAEDTLGRNLSETAAKMAYQNYGDERARQMQAMQMAPGLAQSRFQDARTLMGVGGAREGLEQARLQDQINRYNFEQNRPWEQLAKYSGIIGGGYGSQGTTATPLYSNPAANFLGGALGGAQLGTAAGFDPMMGALGGGLLGVL